MSLLNDMLIDLNRTRAHKTGLLLPAPIAKSRINRFFYALIGLMLGIVMAGCVYGFLYGFHPVFHKQLTHENPTVLSSIIEPVTIKPMIVERFESFIPTYSLAQSDILDIQTEAMDNQPDTTEQLVGFNSDEWLNNHINDALEVIQDGNDQRAIELLTDILSRFPASIEARESLVKLYFSHNELSEAFDLLDEGLNLSPHNLPLIMLKSRLLVEQGQQKEALALLEQFNPDINIEPDYFALLAAIFESLGRVSEAGHIYQKLIRLDPSNGQYWLGLGLAFEYEHANQQAMEAYKHVTESNSIQPSVRTYAEKRLKTLQG